MDKHGAEVLSDPKVEEVLRNHLARSEWFEAAIVHVGLGRNEEAAPLFERARRFAEAASCWFDARNFERTIEAALQVPRRHALHRASAQLAFRAARTLGRRDPRLDKWAEAIAVVGCNETADLQLFDAIDEYDAPAVVVSQPPPPEVPASRNVLPEPGDQFAGRYRIERLLGIGASATVYVARDEAIDESVAVKVMRGPLTASGHARLKREIQLARKLTHESIVRVYDLIAEGGFYGISMEVVDGKSLSDIIEDQSLSLWMARDLLTQAARALAFAHQRGIVHRDVKPDNMLVTPTGVLKISDFGIAKAIQDVPITQTGSVLGTPYYISPEQIQDSRKVDHRTDIYALGVVAYELVTGRVPFPGTSVLDVLRKHLAVQPEPPRSLRPELPPDLEGLILEMLLKDPAERIQSCELVAEQLAKLAL